MRRGWSVLILLIVALAGCAGDKSSDEPADEDDPGEVIEIEPGVKVAENRAVMRGQVINDAGQGLPGARVSLVGTPFFTETPETGRFQFTNVTPGEHTLRVEKEGFQVAEKGLDLKRSNLTTVEVVLLPDTSTGAGYRTHTHDYWGGNERLAVKDSTVTLMSPGGDAFDTYSQARKALLYPNMGGTNTYWWTFYLPDEIPEGNAGVAPGQPALIYPGTKQVEVTFTWDQEDLTLDALNLGYEGANGGDVQWIEGVQSGVAAVIPIEDNETTDDGHQAYSFWQFHIQADNSVTEPTSYQPGAALGDIDVKVEVVFGGLPLEEAHPRFWEDRSQILIRSGDAAMTWPFGVDEYDRSEEMRGSMRPETIVPPGTTRMRVEFSWSYERAGDQTDVDDWSLWFRMADQHPHQTTWDQLRQIEPVEEDVAGQTKVYEFEVPSEWTDAYYQGTNSLWLFYPVREDPDGYEQYTFQEWRATQETFYAEVWAFNDDV